MCITAKRAYTLASVLVISFGTMAHAEEPTWEDLTACQLPNAKMILPGQGSHIARKEGGTVFAFATRTFTPEPDFKEGEFTVAKFIAALKGDIYYAVPEGGCFMVTSGRIADLGKHYLHEFDSKELPRPDIHTSKEDGQDVPGLLTGTQDLTGHCFLLEAKGGKAVLLRILSQDRKKGEAVVQWVHQPDGTRRFAIPKGKIVIDAPTDGHNQSASGTAVNIDVPQWDVREFAKAIQVHRKNRRKIVDLSISLIASKDRDADLSKRHLAAVLLGQLRAVEGAPSLAAHIDDNLAMISLRITVLNSYRCVQSLIDIGIPGAIAAIIQIETDVKSERPKEANQGQWNERMKLRRNLLALVVLKVYGEKLATIMLEDKIAESSDSKVKEAYQKALEAFPRIKNWLPEEKPAATASSDTTVPTK
jgi:hypothetical protein